VKLNFRFTGNGNVKRGTSLLLGKTEEHDKKEKKRSKKGKKSQTGLNFVNIFRATLKHVDPKSTKRQTSCNCS